MGGSFVTHSWRGNGWLIRDSFTLTPYSRDMTITYCVVCHMSHVTYFIRDSSSLISSFVTSEWVAHIVWYVIGVMSRTYGVMSSI